MIGRRARYRRCAMAHWIISMRTASVCRNRSGHGLGSRHAAAAGGLWRRCEGLICSDAGRIGLLPL